MQRLTQKTTSSCDLREEAVINRAISLSLFRSFTINIWLNYLPVIKVLFVSTTRGIKRFIFSLGWREDAARARRPSLPVIPQNSPLAMSSVGHQRSRRPSLYEWHAFEQNVSLRGQKIRPDNAAEGGG